jgi:hypothetical protein
MGMGITAFPKGEAIKAFWNSKPEYTNPILVNSIPSLRLIRFVLKIKLSEYSLEPKYIGHYSIITCINFEDFLLIC